MNKKNEINQQDRKNRWCPNFAYRCIGTILIKGVYVEHWQRRVSESV